jgi:hypothetical protein
MGALCEELNMFYFADINIYKAQQHKDEIISMTTFNIPLLLFITVIQAQ